MCVYSMEASSVPLQSFWGKLAFGQGVRAPTVSETTSHPPSSALGAKTLRVSRSPDVHFLTSLAAIALSSSAVKIRSAWTVTECACAFVCMYVCARALRDTSATGMLRLMPHVITSCQKKEKKVASAGKQKRELCSLK